MPKKTQISTEFQTILFETLSPELARITLNQPDTRNAQTYRMLYELSEAFDLAAHDQDNKIIILAASGPHFSSGHHLKGNDWTAFDDYQPIGSWCGFTCDGAEGQMAREKELYLGLSERLRNIPKVTIAQVQGKVIAGGLMLVWPCDLIIASKNAQFADNTASLGVCGAEFFNHPWELGVRKAKEMLFTSDFVSAEDAFRLGMVNKVVALDDLESATLELAKRIATKPRFALKLIKEAVNACQDASGRVNAMQTTFALHQLSHAHNRALFGMAIDPNGITSDSVRSHEMWRKPDA